MEKLDTWFRILKFRESREFLFVSTNEFARERVAGSSVFAFAPSGISARVSGLKTSACVICNAKYRSESDTTNVDMKNLRGVCAAVWGEPCSALRNASETSTNRGNALGRGESSPQLEIGTAHLPGI